MFFMMLKTKMKTTEFNLQVHLIQIENHKHNTQYIINRKTQINFMYIKITIKKLP